jgi:hypothetical protein
MDMNRGSLDHSQTFGLFVGYSVFHTRYDARASCGVDFIGRYFVPASAFESYGRQLLQSRSREGTCRRPIVCFLRKRWVVHDFFERQSDHAVFRKSVHLPPPLPSAAATPVQGIWFSCETPQKAVLLWCWLVHHRYRALLENGTEILNLTSQFFGDLP